MKVVGCILLSLGLAQAFAPSSLGSGTRKLTSQLSMASEGAEPVLNKYSRYVNVDLIVLYVFVDIGSSEECAE
jgi:hypothetical protein